MLIEFKDTTGVKEYELLYHKPYGIIQENVKLNNLCPLDIEKEKQKNITETSSYMKPLEAIQQGKEKH